MEPALDELGRRLGARGVKYGLASYVDLHGVPKAKAVPLAHLGRMLKASEMFTGAALDGVPQAVNDDEVAALPDAAYGARAAAISALAEYGGPEAIEGIRAGLADKDWAVRVRAAELGSGFRTSGLGVGRRQRRVIRPAARPRRARAPRRSSHRRAAPAGCACSAGT